MTLMSSTIAALDKWLEKKYTGGTPNMGGRVGTRRPGLEADAACTQHLRQGCVMEKSSLEQEFDVDEIAIKYGTGPRDVGGAPVQIARLTNRINRLTKHVQQNPNDEHNRRGLIQLVSQRTRLLEYLRRKDPKGHRNLSADLGLRIKKA